MGLSEMFFQLFGSEEAKVVVSEIGSREQKDIAAQLAIINMMGSAVTRDDKEALYDSLYALHERNQGGKK